MVWRCVEKGTEITLNVANFTADKQLSSLLSEFEGEVLDQQMVFQHFTLKLQRQTQLKN